MASFAFNAATNGFNGADIEYPPGTRKHSVNASRLLEPILDDAAAMVLLAGYDQNREVLITGSRLLKSLKLTGYNLERVDRSLDALAQKGLERRGARVALLTTAGFRDIEIGRANRPDIYNFVYRKPPPFVEGASRSV